MKFGPLIQRGLLLTALLLVLGFIGFGSYVLGRVQGELGVYDSQFAFRKRVIESNLGAILHKHNLSIDRSSDGQLVLYGPALTPDDYSNLNKKLSAFFGRYEIEYMLSTVSTQDESKRESNGTEVFNEQ